MYDNTLTFSSICNFKCKRKTDNLTLMYLPLLIDKAEEAAQYSSEPLGDGRDAATREGECVKVCRSVFMMVNVCEGEGEIQRD